MILTFWNPYATKIYPVWILIHFDIEDIFFYTFDHWWNYILLQSLLTSFKFQQFKIWTSELNTPRKPD